MEPAESSLVRQNSDRLASEWRSVSSLAHLIKKSLPKHAWVERNTTSQIKGLKIIDFATNYTPDFPDFHLCIKNSEYVQCLGYEIDEDPTRNDSRVEVLELSPMVYFVLENYKVIPLPNLESFIVRTETEFLTLHRVVGPKITHLEFASLDHEQAVNNLEVYRYNGYQDRNIRLEFGHLGYKPAVFRHRRAGDPVIVPLPRTLHVLRFRDSYIPHDLSDSLSDFLNDIPDVLESLHLPSCEFLGEASFSAALSSESLQELGIGLLKEEFLEFVPKNSLQRLSQLHVAVEKQHDFIQFLQKIGLDGSSELRWMKIECRITNNDLPPQVLELRGLFSQLQGSCISKKLEFVDLCFFIDNRHHLNHDMLLRNQRYSPTEETISPLFEFRKLRGVNISYQANTVNSLNCSFQINKPSGWFWFKKRSGVTYKVRKVGNVAKESSVHSFVVKMKKSTMMGC